MTTTSWVFTTYTNDGFAIDTRDAGLNMTFLCNAPCLTCPTSNPNSCLSCNTYANSPILYNGQCYQTCPITTYYSASLGTCLTCDQPCQNCNYYDGKICTSCFPDSTLPYLNGNTCSDKCSFGFYGNLTSKKCTQCDAPCFSCEGSSSSCTSCNPNS